MKYSAYSDLLQIALQDLDKWRSSFGEFQSEGANKDKISSIIQELTERLKGNYPFHHPSYAGQMLKPPHPIAWIAYSLAATVNPNNHALDGGPPTSVMEKEVTAKMAKMVGYAEFLGHLSSSGTFANLEALWVLSQTLPKGKKVAYSSQAHYTHERICSVLHIPTIKIPALPNGEWDWTFIDLHKEEIGAFVVTMGTTGMGIVEPLEKVLAFKKKQSIKIHVDSAYGGFFKLIEDELPSKIHWKLMREADSIVIDPHKHGLQPYGCGCVLFKDPKVGLYYKHDSPYTYFSSDDLHLGEISLECSRAGASAAAFWATIELFDLTKDGLGSIIHLCRKAALVFANEIQIEKNFGLVAEPELDIVVYYPLSAKSATELSDLSRKIFTHGMNLPLNEGFHLSLFTIDSSLIKAKNDGFVCDSNQTVVLRSVFMKPEQLEFIPELVGRLNVAIDSVNQ
jgi:glutamate/tyrosine decarboxylase-like PLP-dependent enzyme